MPVIGKINAIILRMYYEDHAPPHFHAVNNETAGLFTISSGEMWRGDINRKDQKTIKKWAQARKEVLQEMWDTQDIYKID
ncbi:MAG: DUF4160 domain-containing protein [Bacteroidota bacterium]